MGSGPGRELSDGAAVVPELSEEIAEKIEAALVKLDGMDADFKRGRDDERTSQQSKAWINIAREIEAYLRTAGAVLVNANQLNCDMAIEGGGRGATPWIEETGMRFKRLEFKLQDSGAIHAIAGDVLLGELMPKKLTYEWVESMTIKWVFNEVARIVK